MAEAGPVPAVAGVLVPVERHHSVLGEVQFDFGAKTAHDAEEALLLTRSDTFKVQTPRPDRDIWKKPPPDFSHTQNDQSFSLSTDRAIRDFYVATPLYPDSLGLEEFDTSYEKDPYNLNFKSRHLDIVHGIAPGAAERDLQPGRQMAPPMSAKPKWDTKLILEKTSWPQRFEGFTVRDINR
ncbi:hypothetical protein C0Q70_09874 [Pomacea canaliculata]|uniref:Uncharacterized protein n=1 Tax=Pomacea canaliculata TaxID=400727 RepID=A0A2T7PB22_POMCA|nr:hypothetical protein C0Q70_09874 [Pomacea canaliculata]